MYTFKDITSYTQEKQKTHQILGITTIVLFYSILLYAYIESYKRNKIGWNTPTNNKYNLISTAFRWTNKHIQTVIIIMFFVSFNVLLYTKNFYNTIDERIIVPISGITIIVSSILLMYIVPERFILHNLIGIILIVSGITIALFIKLVYQNKFVQQDIVDITQIANILYISTGITILIGIFNILNNYILKKHLIPNQNHTIRNILGVGEIVSYIFMGVVIYYIALYPPLP